MNERRSNSTGFGRCLDSHYRITSVKMSPCDFHCIFSLVRLSRHQVLTPAAPSRPPLSQRPRWTRGRLSPPIPHVPAIESPGTCRMRRHRHGCTGAESFPPAWAQRAFVIVTGCASQSLPLHILSSSKGVEGSLSERRPPSTGGPSFVAAKRVFSTAARPAQDEGWNASLRDP